MASDNGVEADYDQSLVSGNLPLVRWLCRKFFYSGEPMDDLVQMGAVGLLKAVKKFDPELGTRFSSYAIPVIIGEIKNYFRDHGWAVKMPRKIQSQNLAVNRSVVTLTQTLGRNPTVFEIAEATGLSPADVEEAFLVEHFGKPLSLDAPYNREGEENGDRIESSILDYLGETDPGLERAAVLMDLMKSLGCLDSREKAIIFFTYHQGLPQTEIAARLGISQMHVSRLLRWALGKLRKDLNNETEE